MDSRDAYDYGWNEKGVRFHALKSGRREGRVNIIAALCDQNLILLKGRVTEQTWLETCLVPTLAGQVVVMDNATFHKGGRIQELIAGCEIVLTPLFSRSKLN